MEAKYKILLIEDDKLDQMAFERLIKDYKLLYDYNIASSVAEAKSILAQEKFNAIVCDYSLGDGTALDILDLKKDIPIIVVTGFGDEEVATKEFISSTTAVARVPILKEYTRGKWAQVQLDFLGRIYSYRIDGEIEGPK